MRTNTRQPGHEYTKGNVKFAVQVSQAEPIKKLQSLVESNKQTPGKSTIGDEKVRIPAPPFFESYANDYTETQCLHDA